jgi:hypothetical protein
MAHLKTKNVFLDTEVIEAANFNFQAAALKELVRLAQANFVKVFLTTITVGEVHAHIERKINEAASKLKRFRGEEGRILQNVAQYEAILQKMDKPTCIEEVKNRFQTFLTNAKVTILDMKSVDVEKVFSDYFGHKPPFGEGRRKEEFPDAFAQETLSIWCEQNHCDMYVISANTDWHAPNAHLIPLVKLQEFIDSALKDQVAELATNVERLYAKHSDRVERAIAEAFKDSEFFTSDVDGDVDEVKIDRLKIDDPFVLEVEEGSATVSVEVEVEYTASVSYLNDDEGIWDGEDHAWSYRPTAYTEAEETEKFEAELEIHYDPSDDDSFDVSCSIDRTFGVTVMPTDYELK